MGGRSRHSPGGHDDAGGFEGRRVPLLRRLRRELRRAAEESVARAGQDPAIGRRLLLHPRRGRNL